LLDSEKGYLMTWFKNNEVIAVDFAKRKKIKNEAFSDIESEFELVVIKKIVYPEENKVEGEEDDGSINSSNLSK
jgi:hypothetical protein